MNSERVWQLVQDYAVPGVTVLIILFVAYLLSSWARRIVKRSCDRVKLDETLGRFFAKMAAWTIMLIAVIFCLGKFGIPTASFAVILGAAGLAIGLAFQGTLASFASGVMLLIFRPFKVGDAVKVGGETGKVFEIDLFTTILDTFDNRRIIMPNSAIFGSTIENITFHPIRRVDVNVGTEYSADLDKVRSVLEKVAQEFHDPTGDKEWQVYLMELGSSSINWVIRVWAPTADFWAIREKVTRQAKYALDEAGIGIPFPQMDVHVDGVLDRGND